MKDLSVKNNNRALLSIIMPTYNREKLLPIAIKSIMDQTYTNWELLIVDDRSTDNTKALIEEYSRKDTRIKYLLNKRKKGPAGARNFGILEAKGKYIAFLDSDDQWLEHHLKASLEVLENHNVKVCLATLYEKTNGKIIDIKEKEVYGEQLERAVIVLKPKTKGNLYFFQEGFFEYNLTERFTLYHINTLVIEKDVLDKIGLFNENLPVNEDYDLLFRIFYDYEFCFIDDHHFIYNFGDDNLYAYTDRELLYRDCSAFKNKSLVCKLTVTLSNRIIAYNYRKETVKNSLDLIDMEIATSYLTLGYIYSNASFIGKIKAFTYYIKALKYRKSKYTWLYILNLFLPFFSLNYKLKRSQLKF